MTRTDKIDRLLRELYGSQDGVEFSRRLDALIAEYRQRMPSVHARNLDERDCILICYPDQVTSPGRSPLVDLAEFAQRHLAGIISGIHVLPFFRSSSDDGFSITDFRAVSPKYGTWRDVRGIAERFDLMVDAVINHASAQSEWFHLFLRNQAPYREYFMRVLGKPDTSAVVRPRTTPLITHFESNHADRAVWTTFGRDQVDLNYRSSELLLEILDILLFYASQGATFLRLDAVAYLWKQLGTSCINLPQTHLIVQLIRAVMDQVAPQVALITETNVPQSDNLSYFGDGTNEAQLVYNFPLPPLVLHAFLTRNTDVLSKWASSARLPSDRVTFLNILATHDGIGLNPLRGFLAEEEITQLAKACVEKGGFVSDRAGPGGRTVPYELNMNYLDALDAVGPDVGADLVLERFVTAHAIMLAPRGVPAFYFHSLFGSRGWREGVISTGRKRTVNREKLRWVRLEADLADPECFRARVFRRLAGLLRARADHAAFSPAAAQDIAQLIPSVFAIRRGGGGLSPQLLCLHNVSPEACNLKAADLGLTSRPRNERFRDVITGDLVGEATSGSIHLAPYQALWLESVFEE